MKVPTGSKRHQAGKRKQRPTYRPKIRWEVLGLSDPVHDESTTPIEIVRREVSSLASLGFGPGTRSRTASQGEKSKDRAFQANAGRARRN